MPQFNASDFVGKTETEIQAMLAAVRAEVKSKAVGGIKISEKGGVSVYGLGRFPVTLYATQWSALAEKLPEVLAFIDANRDNPKLASKAVKDSTEIQ